MSSFIRRLFRCTSLSTFFQHENFHKIKFIIECVPGKCWDWKREWQSRTQKWVSRVQDQRKLIHFLLSILSFHCRLIFTPTIISFSVFNKRNSFLWHNHSRPDAFSSDCFLTWCLLRKMLPSFTSHRTKQNVLKWGCYWPSFYQWLLSSWVLDWYKCRKRRNGRRQMKNKCRENCAQSQETKERERERKVDHRKGKVVVSRCDNYFTVTHSFLWLVPSLNLS